MLFFEKFIFTWVSHLVFVGFHFSGLYPPGSWYKMLLELRFDLKHGLWSETRSELTDVLTYELTVKVFCRVWLLAPKNPFKSIMYIVLTKAVQESTKKRIKKLFNFRIFWCLESIWCLWKQDKMKSCEKQYFVEMESTITKV